MVQMTATATKTRKTTKKASWSKTPEQRAEESKAAHDKLTAQIETLSTTEGWKNYLRAASTFHKYSFNNVMLIMIQYPGATQVAGFKKWLEVGRCVRKGEKAIKIFGFSKRIETDPVTGKETEHVFFPLVSVFAQEQTDVVDAEKWEKHEKAGDVYQMATGEDEDGIGDAVAAWLTGKGWDVAEEVLTDGREGYTRPRDNTVRTRVGLEPAGRAAVLIHEAAHIVCGHTDDLAEYSFHRGRMECEAEGTAYVVAQQLGIDTEGMSAPYLLGWAENDMELIKGTAEAVLKAAKVILDGIAPKAE